MQNKKETRGAKKGRPKPPGSGRKKSTEPKREKAFTVRFNKEELDFVNEILNKINELNKINRSKPDILLKILNKIETEVKKMTRIKEYMKKYNFTNFLEGKSNDTLIELQYLIMESRKYPPIWLRITEEYISLSFLEAYNEVAELCEIMKVKLGFENKENIQTCYLDIFLKKYDHDNYEKKVEEMLNMIKDFIQNDEEYLKSYKIMF